MGLDEYGEIFVRPCGAERWRWDSRGFTLGYFRVSLRDAPGIR
jgi:hypothetical protein